MKIWITKYCLTKGIEEKEGVVCSNDDDIVKILKNNIESGQCTEYYCGKGKVWHVTRESAIKKSH